MDAFRWAAMVEGVFVLGTLVALYERVWRFALPIVASRLIIVAAGMTVGGYVVELHDRLGQALSWRVPLSLTALTLYIVGLGSMYVWTRMPDGRKQRHEAIARYNALRMLRAEEARKRAEERAAKL